MTARDDILDAAGQRQALDGVQQELPVADAVAMRNQIYG